MLILRGVGRPIFEDGFGRGVRTQVVELIEVRVEDGMLVEFLSDATPLDDELPELSLFRPVSGVRG